MVSKQRAVKKIEITDRDEKMLLALERFRIMTSEQMEFLTDTRRRKVNDRLALMRLNDYTDRLTHIEETMRYQNKRPALHALGNQSAVALEKFGITFPPSVDWKQKNKNVKSIDFIWHTLGVTETMLRAEKNMLDTPGLACIDKSEVWACAPKFNARKKEPFHIPTEFNWLNGELVKRKTIPDYTFAIEDNRGSSKQEGLHFLEYDRCTESLVKSSTRQSCILKKYFGYADMYKRKYKDKKHLVEVLYGYRAFRVLWVIEGTQRRIDSMVKLFSARMDDRIPAGAFLFTTIDQIKEEGFLAPIWVDAKGTPTPVIKNSPLARSTPSDLLSKDNPVRV